MTYVNDLLVCCGGQIRALLFVTVLTAGIVNAMEGVEKAVATALNLQQTGLCRLATDLYRPSELCMVFHSLSQRSGRLDSDRVCIMDAQKDVMNAVAVHIVCSGS